MTSKRFLILVSPRGDLTVRRADWFRLCPNDHVRRWQVLTYVRDRHGRNLDRLLGKAYEHLVRLYQL